MSQAIAAQGAHARRGERVPPVECVVCESQQVEPFLDLGSTALANRFPTKEDLGRSESRFPLVVGFCHACAHVQLTQRVPPEEMFSEYLYVSSASDTLTAHFDDLSRTLAQRLDLGPDDLVIDIGCNDGTLLAAFAREGVRTLGVDPARNLAELGTHPNVERYVGFFDSRSAREIAQRWGRAALVTATNTFPHLPHLRDFLEGIDTVLGPGGAFVLEAHYLGDLLDQVAFDTIYHEHVSYWALGPMIELFHRHGMEAVHAERLPLHHGQLRVTVQRTGEGEVRPSVQQILEAEETRGLARFETYVEFADHAQRIKGDLVPLLRRLKSQGHRLAGYGAPAKGSTLLEFLEIGPDLIDFIADRSPLKQGRFMPGSHIPIVPPDRLLTDRPEYVLLLAWNFVDEVLEQQSEYRRRGGRFIVPVPKARVL